MLEKTFKNTQTRLEECLEMLDLCENCDASNISELLGRYINEDSEKLYDISRALGTSTRLIRIWAQKNQAPNKTNRNIIIGAIKRRVKRQIRILKNSLAMYVEMSDFKPKS